MSEKNMISVPPQPTNDKTRVSVKGLNPVTNTVVESNGNALNPTTEKEVDELLAGYFIINPQKYRAKRDGGEYNELYKSVGVKTVTADRFKEIEKRAIKARVGELTEEVEAELSE